MGQCQCCDRKDAVNTEKERHIIKDLEQVQENNQNPIIKTFILKNLEILKNKQKYQNKLFSAQSLFNKKIPDPFFNEQNYYKEKFVNKLKETMNSKRKFFKELFPDDYLLKMNSFDYIKNKLGNYYNDDIYENKINFYKNFVDLMKVDEITIQTSKRNSHRKSLNTNFMDFISKNSSNIKKFQNEKNLSGFSALKFGDINLDKEQKYIKKDIDVLYRYCFNVEKLPNFDVCQKRCKLLSLLSQNSNFNFNKLSISSEFINFIKTLYYIILLKKCNFLSNTGENIFYIINKKQIPTDTDSKETDIDLLRQYFKKDNKNNNIDIDIKSNKDIIKDNKDNMDNFYKINSKNTVGAKFKRKSRNKFSLTLIQKNNIINNFNFSNTNGDLSSKNNDNFDTNLNKSNIFSKRTNITKTTNITNIYKTNIQVYRDTRARRHLSKAKLKTVIERNSFLSLKRLKSSKILEEEYYSGQYDNTTYLYAGFGTLIEPDKNLTYTGTFRYGLKDGLGLLYEEPDNNMMIFFTGEFRNNKIKGYGEKINLKENLFVFKEGLFNDQTFLQGKVKIIRENIIKGEINVINYNGDVSNEVFDGFGILTQKTYILNELKKYDFVYEKEYRGHFKKGKENGKGILRYNNAVTQENYKYSGNFVDGLRDGYGVINYGENFFIQKYEGFFREDKPFSTYGIAYFKSGDIYEGFFDDNYQKDYMGNYSFFDPISKIINVNYFGGFYNDAKQGLGRIYHENKECSKLLKGNFYNGDKQGFFEINEYNVEMVKKKINPNSRRKRMSIWNFGELEITYEKKQCKSYILFEQNEIMEKNETPFDDSLYSNKE